MTGSHAEPDKLAEVARLATAIADRILEQNEAGTTIPLEQFNMLVRAAGCFRTMAPRGRRRWNKS